MNALLSIRDLEVTFATEAGPLCAVHDVSLDVAPGETLAIVGESGSGKSVTMLSLLGLLPAGAARARQVTFDGQDITALGEAELRGLRGREIGIVFQDPMTSLNPVLTVGRQLTEMFELHRGLSSRAAEAAAVETLALVGMPSPRERMATYPHQLSGGMRQRAMIAIAVACRPKLLIADEPTTALDVTIQAQILDLIARIQDELAMGVILISHDLGVVAGVADRIAVMYAGRIVETGPIDAVFDAPRMPYTRGLLASVPRYDLDAAMPQSIPGAPPDPLARPAGCAFRPRCAEARPACAEAPPQLRAADTPAHRAACILVGEDGA